MTDAGADTTAGTGVDGLSWCWRWLRPAALCPGRKGIVDKANDLGQRVIVAQLQIITAWDVVGLADCGQDFGLLHRVDAQVGFQIEFQVQHLGRVARLLADQSQHALGDGIGTRRG